ncbi:hypothetical protein C3E88_07485, partial [Clostridium sp. Cult3]|nr:hypothetical protein [Clostridium sp. Cult3]
ERFLKEGPKEEDILENLSIKKDNRKATFLSMRNCKGDYAILNVALSNLLVDTLRNNGYTSVKKRM